MTAPSLREKYRGVFPAVPTIFDEQGSVDLEGQQRCVEFMIYAGSHGFCILANFSEQFVLSDAERELLTTEILKHVRGRVPVIVTTTHFSTKICAERSRRAQDDGAAMVMTMPPYHGAAMRATPSAIRSFFEQLSNAISIMVQDAPVSGTPLPASFLAQLAREIEHVAYFKIESAQAAAKLRELIELGGDAAEGPGGWRRGHHTDGRSGRRLYGSDDRRRLPRPRPAHPRQLSCGKPSVGDRPLRPGVFPSSTSRTTSPVFSHRRS